MDNQFFENDSNSNLVVEEPVVTSNMNNATTGKKNSKIIVAFTIIVLAIIMVIIFSPFAKGVNVGKFLGKMDGNNFNLFGKMFEFIEKNDAVKTTVKVDMKDIAELMGEDNVESNVLKLEIIDAREKEKFIGQIEMKMNNNSLIKTQFVKDDATIALKVEDITEKFLALNLKEMDKFLENMGIDKEEIEENMPVSFDELVDSVETPEDLQKNLKKYEKVLPSYIKIITDYLDANEKVEKDAEIEIAGETVKATRYYVEIDQRMVNEISLEILKKAEKDKELYQLFEEMQLEMKKEEWEDLDDEDLKEWKKEIKDNYQEKIEYAIEQLSEMLEEESDDEEKTVIKFSIYKKDNHMIAISTEVVEDKDEVEAKIMFALTEKKDTSHMEITVESKEADSKFTIAFDLERKDDAFDGKFSIIGEYTDRSYDYSTWEMKEEKKEIEVVIAKIKVEKSKEGKEILKDFESEEVIMLNEKTREELEEIIMDISDNLEEYMEGLEEKLIQDFGNYNVLGGY